MKKDKFLLAGIFILAIFAIGAVGASENVTQEEVLTVENDSSEVLSDEPYCDDDFYIAVNEDYSHDKSDWEDNRLVYIASYSQRNGTFKVCVDDVERQSFNITEGHFACEDDGYGGTYNRYYQYIYPGNLGIDECGTYNILIGFNDDVLINTSVCISEKGDFDIWLQNPYYSELEYWSFPSFMVIDSNHFSNGTLEIYVNGTRKISYTLINGNFEEIPDCSNRSRYIAASDLFKGCGTYNLQINFTENGLTKTLMQEDVIAAEFAPTTDPKLELYFDLNTLVLPADNYADIYLPREATGTLRITYNNVDKTIEYSKGRARVLMESWNLNHLGDNVITVTYTGNDFGTLKATGIVKVLPLVTSPDYVGLGDEFTISVRTHEWVNGYFKVYDYNSGSKGKLLKSVELTKRYMSDYYASASAKLTGNTAGLNSYWLEFDYPGGESCNLISEVYVVKNSGNITADMPTHIDLGSNLTVRVNAPDIEWTFAQVKVDSRAAEFLLIENGQAITNISDLGTGYHKVTVLYDNRIFDERGNLVGDVYMKTFTVGVGIETKITASKLTTVYNVGKNWVIALKENDGNVLAGKTLAVKLNGKTYTKTTDKNGQIRISVSLPAKTYTAKISFAGDETHLGSSADAKVVVSKAKPKLSAKSKTFKVKSKTKKVTATLKDNKGRAMKNIKLTLKIKNRKYTVKTNNKGVATFKVKLTKKGNYKAKIDFKANSNYNAVSRTVKIKIK